MIYAPPFPLLLLPLLLLHLQLKTCDWLICHH